MEFLAILSEISLSYFLVHHHLSPSPSYLIYEKTPQFQSILFPKVYNTLSSSTKSKSFITLSTLFGPFWSPYSTLKSRDVTYLIQFQLRFPSLIMKFEVWSSTCWLCTFVQGYAIHYVRVHFVQRNQNKSKVVSSRHLRKVFLQKKHSYQCTVISGETRIS